MTLNFLLPCGGQENVCMFSMSQGTLYNYVLLLLLLYPSFSGWPGYSSAFRFPQKMIANLPDVLLGFQPRKRKACNHLRPIASSHFLVFPPSHAHTGTGFTLSQVCQVCSLLSHPWLWPVVGTIGWIGWKDKSYFLIILFIEHSRTLPAISLQMPSHCPCEIVLRIKWDCIKGVDKMQRTIKNVRQNSIMVTHKRNNPFNPIVQFQHISIENKLMY